MVWQDNGISPCYIRGELSVGDVAVYPLDQVRVRAAGDGLVRCCPAFPGLADYGQAELAGLLTVECTKRCHKVLDALKRANHADVQKVEWLVGGMGARGDLRRNDVVVRAMWHYPDERITQRVYGWDGSQVVVRMNHMSIYQGQ